MHRSQFLMAWSDQNVLVGLKLAIDILTSSNSSCMSLVHTKWLSFFKRLRIRYVFLERLGTKADMKFTVQFTKKALEFLFAVGCS